MNKNEKTLEQEEIEDAHKLPQDAQQVVEIAKAVANLSTSLSRELVFKAMVQVIYGRINWN